jgi:hypothetical protein
MKSKRTISYVDDRKKYYKHYILVIKFQYAFITIDNNQFQYASKYIQIMQKTTSLLNRSF